MTKCEHTLKLLRKRWLSPLKSVELGGCLSLSQRVSIWRRQGISIDSRWVKSASGVRYMEYRCARKAA